MTSIQAVFQTKIIFLLSIKKNRVKILDETVEWQLVLFSIFSIEFRFHKDASNVFCVCNVFYQHYIS